METREVLELGVLGLLAEEPATVESLRDRFNHNFGRHQFAGYGSLNPLLDRLREDGYISGDATLEVTAQGQAYLRDLLRTPVENVRDPSHHAHLFVKLTLLHHLPTNTQREELATLETQFQEALETVRDIADAHHGDGGRDERLPVFSLQEELVETYLAWVADRRQELPE